MRRPVRSRVARRKLFQGGGLAPMEQPSGILASKRRHEFYSPKRDQFLHNYGISFFAKFTIPYIECDMTREEIVNKVKMVENGQQLTKVDLSDSNTVALFRFLALFVSLITVFCSFYATAYASRQG